MKLVAISCTMNNIFQKVKFNESVCVPVIMMNKCKTVHVHYIRFEMLFLYKESTLNVQ